LKTPEPKTCQQGLGDNNSKVRTILVNGYGMIFGEGFDTHRRKPVKT